MYYKVFLSVMWSCSLSWQIHFTWLLQSACHCASLQSPETQISKTIFTLITISFTRPYVTTPSSFNYTETSMFDGKTFRGSSAEIVVWKFKCVPSLKWSLCLQVICRHKGSKWPNVFLDQLLTLVNLTVLCYRFFSLGEFYCEAGVYFLYWLVVHICFSFSLG